MTLAELIAGLLASQEASGFEPHKIFEMKLILSDFEEISGARIVDDPKDEGSFAIILSDCVR
jgi:hypothetical protein